MRKYFSGVDYYKGLSGTFTTETLDRLNLVAVEQNRWETVRSGRPRNDLSYGTGTLGVTFLPTDRLAVTGQGNLLFGDVNGWSVSLSGSISF